MGRAPTRLDAARWLGLALSSAALVACYAPDPPAGAPCANGVCPTPLVCSQATNTCERSDIDAGGSGGNSYRVPITLSASVAATDVPVLVVLDASFSYTHAAVDGSDVRLAGDTAASEMPHWTETWNQGGVSRIWGRVPSVVAGSNTIYAYYGSPARTSSDFAAVFPNTYRTTGDATLGGAVTYDAVIIETGTIVTVQAGTPLAITAPYVRITGTLTANAAGYAGAMGPGAGGMSTTGGAGGGGYGGDGGLGGKDPSDTPGTGGAAYGGAMTDIDMGSGGGVTDVATTGAHGGGAVRIEARRIVVDGSIEARGEAGMSAARSGGGGAGGGVLLRAASLAFTGSIAVPGGAGGPMVNAGNDGGGGGGGGRIKLFEHGEIINSGMTDVAGGGGGVGGDTAPGQPGLAGATYVGTSTMIDALPVVGSEQSI